MAETTSLPVTPVPQPPVRTLLCPFCWADIEDRAQTRCSYDKCAKPQPAEGWTRLPFDFRRRFRFQERLGRGGMGAVFKAWDEESKQWWALKVIQRRGTPLDIEGMKVRFGNEVGMAAMLGNKQEPGARDCFVRVPNYDLSDPAYLRMELVEWPTLQQMLESSGRFGTLQLCHLGSALLHAVQLMHDNNIVHRDLKPENLFVQRLDQAPHYHVKIADLGLAVTSYEPRPGTTAAPPPGWAGTTRYMSPEQQAGKHVTCRSDLHTVGSILWQLATGRLPYPDDPQREQQLRQPPTRPAEMDERLFAILARALAHDAAARWPDARSLRKALEQLAESILAQRAQVLERLRATSEKLGWRLKRLEEQLGGPERLRRRLATPQRKLTALRQGIEERDPAALGAEARALEQELESLEQEVKSWAETLVGPPPPRSKLLPALAAVVLLLAGLVLGAGGVAVLGPAKSRDASAPTQERVPRDSVAAATEPTKPAAAEVEAPLVVQIETVPEECLISVNGKEIGTSPCPWKVEGSGPFVLAAEKEGYLTFRKEYADRSALAGGIPKIMMEARLPTPASN